MDAQNKENQQDNMIDDALENFISDKELPVSEKRSIDTSTCPNETCDSENPGKKAINIRQFIKEYWQEHKEEAIGMIIALGAWGINALHKKNSQKNENTKFDETGDDSLQLNENEQITQDNPTDEELLSRRDDQEYYIKSIIEMGSQIDFIKLPGTYTTNKLEDMYLMNNIMVQMPIVHMKIMNIIRGIIQTYLDGVKHRQLIGLFGGVNSIM